jgi:hypothetical protein
MADETREEILRKYITAEDLTRFKWRILKYMCDMIRIYDTFPETLLFHRTDLKSYIDQKLSQEYSHGTPGTLYKIIMDNVMDCLMDRDAVEKVTEYEYGDSMMVLYGRKKILNDLRDEFKKYEMIDYALLNRLLPKRLS